MDRRTTGQARHRGTKSLPRRCTLGVAHPGDQPTTRLLQSIRLHDHPPRLASYRQRLGRRSAASAVKRRSTRLRRSKALLLITPSRRCKQSASMIGIRLTQIVPQGIIGLPHSVFALCHRHPRPDILTLLIIYPINARCTILIVISSSN